MKVKYIAYRQEDDAVYIQLIYHTNIEINSWFYFALEPAWLNSTTFGNRILSPRMVPA